MVNNNTKEVRFTMRLSQELYEKLKNIAEKEKRSIAKQISYFLEKATV